MVQRCRNLPNRIFMMLHAISLISFKNLRLATDSLADGLEIGSFLFFRPGGWTPVKMSYEKGGQLLSRQLLICPIEKGKRLLLDILSFSKRSQQQHNAFPFLTRSAQPPHLMRVSCSDLFVPWITTTKCRECGICTWNLLPIQNYIILERKVQMDIP